MNLKFILLCEKNQDIECDLFHDSTYTHSEHGNASHGEQSSDYQDMGPGEGVMTEAKPSGIL